MIDPELPEVHLDSLTPMSECTGKPVRRHSHVSLAAELAVTLANPMWASWRERVTSGVFCRILRRARNGLDFVMPRRRHIQPRGEKAGCIRVMSLPQDLCSPSEFHHLAL